MLKPFADTRSICRVIEPALWAPSVFNTQPWSFRITADDRIELRANVSAAGRSGDDRYGRYGDGPGRGRWDLLLRSPAPGPWAREYAISCGAALMNLRLAIRVLGHDPVVSLVPDPVGDPGLLAAVEIVTARTHKPSLLEQELYEAIWLRHTDRWPFSNAPVRPGILVEMERAAAGEHGWLRLMHGPYARRWLKLAADADAAFAASDGSGRDGSGLAAEPPAGQDTASYGSLLAQFRAELSQWTGTSAGYGLPGAVLAPPSVKGGPPVRDFLLGAPAPGDATGRADATGPGGTHRERFERHPQLMILFTDRDEPVDWLRAGQALQRALLTGTSLGVSASFLTQPLEVADLAFRYDPQRGKVPHPPGWAGLASRAGHVGAHHHQVDSSQRDSSSPADRRGYARRRLLGATPWLEVPQMVIRVGYPKANPAKPAARAPRQEPDVVDARCDPPRHLHCPQPGPGSPQPGPGSPERESVSWKPRDMG